MAATDIIFTLGKVGVGTTEKLSTLTVQAKASFALPGTVAKTSGSSTLTGTSTKFLDRVGIGDRITVPGGASETKFVTAIASQTSLTVDSNFANTASGQTATVLPSTARFEDSAGVSQVLISDEGRVGIGTTDVADWADAANSPILAHLHAADSGPFLLRFSTDETGSDSGVGMYLAPSYDGSGDPALNFNSSVNPNIDVLMVDPNVVWVAGFKPATREVSSNTTLEKGDHTVLAVAGGSGVTITLPAVTGNDRRVYFVFKSDSGVGAVTVSPDGSGTINGVNASKTISTQWNGIRLCCLESVGWIATALTAA